MYSYLGPAGTSGPAGAAHTALAAEQPVAVINIFLGWLLIPWVIALAMGFGDTRHND